jgi:hypothetical protein
MLTKSDNYPYFTIYSDLEIDSAIFRRLQLLSKLFIDLVRKRYDKGPFASVLQQSDTSLIEFLAVICVRTSLFFMLP